MVSTGHREPLRLGEKLGRKRIVAGQQPVDGVVPPFAEGIPNRKLVFAGGPGNKFQRHLVGAPRLAAAAHFLSRLIQQGHFQVHGRVEGFRLPAQEQFLPLLELEIEDMPRAGLTQHAAKRARESRGGRFTALVRHGDRTFRVGHRHPCRAIVAGTLQ